MDTTKPSVPTQAEKERFLKKIKEWHALGFDTGELEGLLENDFNEFLRRRHQVLKEQVKLEGASTQIQPLFTPPEEPEVHKKPNETEEPEEDVGTDDEPVVEPAPEKLVAPTDSTPAKEKDVPDDGLLLIGEPIPPEETEQLESAEESVIVVGKVRREQKVKVHRTREIEIIKGVPEELDYEGDVDIDVEAEVEVDEEEELEPKVEEEVDLIEEDIFENEEGGEEEEVGDEDEYDDEGALRRRKGRSKSLKRPGKAEPGVSAGGKIGAVVVIIIIVLAAYYFYWIDPTITDDEENILADFDIMPSLENYSPGSIITLDASTSEGTKLNYEWDIDDGFIVTEGSLQSKIIIGYFTATEKIQKTKSIRLKISKGDLENTITKDVSIEPKGFTIAEEKVGDQGKFQVDGTLTMTNPDGIMTLEIDDDDFEGSYKVESINIKFKTKGSDLMSLELDIPQDNSELDGFRQAHSVYERSIIQNLDLSGTVSGTATIVRNPYNPVINNENIPVHADVDGTMKTTDNSNADLKTHNILSGRATNDMDLTITPKYQDYSLGDYPIASKDTVESYPDLRNNPMNIRLTDLSNDLLELGDWKHLPIGDTIFLLQAEKIEYIYERPAIKVNLTIDDTTMDVLNLQKFFLSFWIAEDISQPVKTHLYSIHLNEDGNKTTLNHISKMTSFSSGDELISGSDCLTSTTDGHFFNRMPGYNYTSSNDWDYLPPTGKSKVHPNSETSFDGFTQEEAMNKIKLLQEFVDYKNNHPNCYVVSGYCSASGEPHVGISQGTLVWNLTFGTKDSTDGLNVIIPKMGNVTVEQVKIDAPPNSTSDFDPLLSFGGSEDVLLNWSGTIFHNIIFEDSRIDFDNIKYGIETNLQYPNVDITSIMFIEHSKYAFYISYNQQLTDGQRIVSVALDAETGQFLFYWDHEDNGLSIF